MVVRLLLVHLDREMEETFQLKHPNQSLLMVQLLMAIFQVQLETA